MKFLLNKNKYLKFLNRGFEFLFFSFLFLLFFSKTVFAAWDGNPYDPGETYNPECLPSQTNCDVTPALTSFTESDPIFMSASSTFAKIANNLSDLTSSSTARTNLGLGALSLLSDLSTFTTDNLAEGINQYFTTAKSRESLSSSATGLTYSTTTGAFSLTSGYEIPTTASSSNWNTAYSWGNHSLGGYLTSFTESDPLFMAASSSLAYQPIGSYLTSESDPVYSASSWFSTTNNATDWNSAYGWGNHAGLYDLLGTATSSIETHNSAYDHGLIATALQSFTESDPIFMSASSTFAKIANNLSDLTSSSTARTNLGLGALSLLSDLSTFTTDNLAEGINQYFTTAKSRESLSSSATGLTYSTTTGAFSLTSGYEIPTTASSSNWNTAYSWGNHSLGGYLTSFTESDPLFMAASSSLAYQPIGSYLTSESDPVYSASSWFSTTNNATDWNSAYGWGNHAGLYDLLGTATSSIETHNSAYDHGLIATALQSFTESDPIFMSASSTFAKIANNLSDLTSSSTARTNLGLGALSLLSDLSTFTTDNLAEGTNKYFSNTLARSSLSSSATGLSYSTTTGAFSLTSGYEIPLSASTTNWNTAYGWGNHSLGGYLKLDQTTPQTAIGSFTFPSVVTSTIQSPSSVLGTTYAQTNTTAWTVSTGSYTNNTAVGPLGATDAQTLTLTTGNEAHYDMYKNLASLFTAGSSYKLTMWAKLGTATNLSVVVNNAASWKTIGGKLFSSADGLNSSTWTEITYYWTAPSVSANIHLGAAQEGIGNQTAGTVYLWGIKVEQVTSPLLSVPIGQLGAPVGLVGTPAYTFNGDPNTGMWSPAADTLAWSTAGTERLRITSTGNMGIGTTDPSTKLHVSSSGNTGLTVTEALASKEAYMNFYVGGVNVGTFEAFGATFGTAVYQNALTFTSQVNNTGNIQFITKTGAAWYTRLMVNNAGNVGIGTTSPSYKLHIVESTDGNAARFQNSTSYCDIDPDTSAWSCSSDRSLKENIQSLPSEDILAKIGQIRPVSFNWISDVSDGEKRGLIAQEVEEVFPDLVNTDKETGLKSIAYGGFVTYLIQSVQELNKKILSLFDGVANIFVGNLKVKDQICIGETCIDETMLMRIIESNGGQIEDYTGSTGEAEEDVESDLDVSTTTPEIEVETDLDSTSTEEIIVPTPIEEDVLIPEPVVEPSPEPLTETTSDNTEDISNNIF